MKILENPLLLERMATVFQNRDVLKRHLVVCSCKLSWFPVKATETWSLKIHSIIIKVGDSWQNQITCQKKTDVWISVTNWRENMLLDVVAANKTKITHNLFSSIRGLPIIFIVFYWMVDWLVKCTYYYQTAGNIWLSWKKRYESSVLGCC